MTPAELCIRRPVATVMVFLSMLVLGLVSARFLDLELFPEVDVPFLFIQLPYPGSTPTETERSLIRPAEEALATLSGIQFMNSRATADGANIFLAFDWRANLGAKALEARERLDAVRDELPADLRQIQVFKWSTSDEAALTLRISSERDLSEAYDMLTRTLVRPIERLPGVARVDLQGVEPKEIRIELLSDRIEALGVDLESLNTLLRGSNFSVSAGMISQGATRYRVKPLGEFRSIDEIRQLVIDESGTRLEQVAEITYEPGERTYARHLDRRYAIGLSIYRERGANLVNVVDAALQTIDRAKQSSDMQGIQLFVLEDQADGVKTSLRELLSAGLLGALLSLGVLYAFLRSWPITFMVSLAVPISITVALGVMYLAGFTLNVLSMMGLMLAVGMLVDNAVVVSESIFTERARTPNDPVGAASRGVRSVGLAVLAGTLTTMAVFLPNLFGEMDMIKIFMQHVAAAICLSLTMSLIIAQTLIPLAATRLPAPRVDQSDGLVERLKDRYARFLDYSLRHRWKAWMGIALIVVSVIIPAKLVEQDMFPQTFDRTLFLRYNLDSAYPLERIAKEAVAPIEDYLYENAAALEIDKVYTYYDEQGTAQSSILLIDKDRATRSSVEVKDEIIANLPTIAIGRPSFEEQRTAGTEGVTLSLMGESSEQLAELAAEVMFQLEQVEGLQELRSSATGGEREVRVRVDRERAARYGFSARQIAETIAVALRGTQLNEFQGAEGEVPVTLRFADADRQTVEQLAGIHMIDAQGQRVPLSSMVDIEVVSGPMNIERTDRQTALTIRASLAKEATMDDVRPRIEQVMDAYAFPPGYSWKFGRGFEFQDETAANMTKNTLLAVVFIYLIMAALFESMLHPLAIVSGIAFSVIGVFWFFLLTGTTFSLMAFIGILVLIGVVVNNGIVLVDHINQLRRRGMLRREAVVMAGRDRLRPILMTVGTTVLGLLPLCFGASQIGGDGPPYFPMARAIVGGLVFSTVISLLVLPNIYMTLDDLGLWAQRRWAAARERRGWRRQKA